jgi:hypothetical protein
MDCSMELVVAVCSINQLVFVIETLYPSYDVGTEFLNGI